MHDAANAAITYFRLLPEAPVFGMPNMPMQMDHLRQGVLQDLTIPAQSTHSCTYTSSGYQ
jgi:hypothetical protein